MGFPIAESWIYTTMLIENEWGESGSGFLVSRQIDEKHGRVFLVTNKHVLNKEAEMRQSASWVKLYLNYQNENGSITGKTAKLALNLNDGSKRWREHPDQDIDVLAFDVSALIAKYPQIKGKWANYSDFGDQNKREELDVTMGDEIMVIGYPLGLRQGKTNFPLVRSGIIATRIGETLEDDYKESNGTIRKRILRGFLIDGATIPGSSGSPVVLKPTTGRLVKGKILMSLAPAILLGIIAETRYAPVHTLKGDTLSFAGLGLAFDAETVKETIELFF
jgi:S1-C subfamily serine protease